ncbi:hypothetical protein GLOIN_2v1778799 [Rhizophagus clarus]|uniref:AAA+ ATPase domain-containing protein n=1 Tax=Rhizophagus clarus TaxID=94130 RepID=A0A8H3LYV1_9GLOM|nr:hypothetical protein GLOIN_2v1778799 [Rhizophagus clarus]
MDNNSITFHVHLPTNIEKLGNPIIIIDGKELGDWIKPIIKLNRPYINHPTYWSSEPIDFSKIPILKRLKIIYTYVVNIPSALLFLEETKTIGEGSVDGKRRTLSNERNIFDIWINGNNPDLAKYQIDNNNILDYVFVDLIYDKIRNHNLKESVLEYKKLLSLYKDLTIKFSDLDYITRESSAENSFRGQRIFLCLLLGYHISRERNSLQFKLPTNFKSDLLLKSFINYKKNILPDDDHNFIFLALICLIQHNASQTKLDWLVIFTIIKEFDPDYNFLKNLKNIKYDEKYSEKFKSHINDIELFENKLKVIQWMLQLCRNMESIFQVWNILLVRNKQITQCFIIRIQEIISNGDTNTLLEHYSKIPIEFHDRVSYIFRSRILILLSNPDRSWEVSNIASLVEIFMNDNLKWNDDDILTSLELISKSHNLVLLQSFPKILNDWFNKGFSDKSIPTICRNWMKLFFLKLGIKKAPTDDSRHVITIFQILNCVYPFFDQRIDIWNDLSTIAIDMMKEYPDYCILGATKSMIELSERDIKRLFIEISKERLNKTVKQVNDQLMKMIMIICGYKIEDEEFDDFPLNVPNAMCENILCYIILILQNQSTVFNNPTEEYLSILKHSKFWYTILNAIGSVEKFSQNSYLQHIRMSIYELNNLLLEKTINLQLLKQILEYSDDYLSNHFTVLKTTNIITQDEFVVIRLLYDDHSNRLDQLNKFYQEFCTSPKVTDVNIYIQDLRQRIKNLDKIKLNQLQNLQNLESNQTVVLDYWKSHYKILSSAERCYNFIQFQTFRNVFEVYFQNDNSATKVEYIASNLMPFVFDHYISMCKKFKNLEKIKSSDALLFWKNVKNFDDEFNLNKELGPYKNFKLLRILENLLKLPQMIERLENLEKIEKILQLPQMGNNDSLSKFIRKLKDYTLLLEVNHLVDHFEKKYIKIDENCWNLIKEISNSKKFLDFLKTISDHDIKNLINNINDDDSILIQEDIIFYLIQIKQILCPFLNKKMKNIFEFLEELSIIINKDPSLVNKFMLCNNNDELPNTISNIEEINMRKMMNIVSNGIFIFLRDEKIQQCSVILKLLTNDTHDLNYILKLAKKSKVTNNFNDLIDIIQKIINVATKLIQNGHFDYRKFEKRIKGLEDMKEFLIFLIGDLEKWNNLVNQAQKNCYYLTLFSANQILEFYDYFTSEKLDKENEERCKALIKFVNSNAQLPSHKKIKRISRVSNDYFEILCEIGYRLENIFKNLPKQWQIIQQEVIPDDIVKDNRLFITAYNDKLLVPNIIMSLYVNSGYYPEPWQLLLCTSSTTIEEIGNFIKRCSFASDNGYSNNLFCIANLESLDFDSQYNLVNYIKELEYRNDNYQLVLLCYRESEKSQYILDQNSLDIDILEISGLNNEIMQGIYRELCPNVLCVSSDLSGQGKTEWIKEISYSKQKIPRSFLISDRMNFKYLVNKLKGYNLKDIESLHINILSTDYPEDVNLFLFELLTFKIVSYKDLIVSISETYIYIEIASSVKQKLLDRLPILRFLPFKHLSWNIENLRISQEIMNPIHIVCHYLNLYDHGEIDKKEILLNTLNPLPVEKCRNLIMRYFFKDNNNISSFRNIEIFINVLADQLFRFSSSGYFTIDNLKSNESNAGETSNIRSIIVKSLIKVSRDFATKFKVMNEDKSDTISQLDNVDHNIMFFNSRELNSFTILYQDKSKIPKNIKSLLKNQVISGMMDDYNTMFSDEFLTKLEGITCKSSTQKPEYILTSDNLIKMALILLRVNANVPVVICGEAGCGKTSLIAQLALMIKVQYQFLNLYDGIEEETIIKFISDALKKSEKEEVWLLFDEINTCNCLGLLTDLISNRMFQGKPINSNVQLFATCNPYRPLVQNEDDRVTNIKKYKERGNLIYQVNPLPEQISDYIWNYDVLLPKDEYRYIQIMVKNELNGLAQPVLVELINASQKFIRKVEKPYSVSLRDVKRSITLVKFFYNSLNNRPTYKKGQKYPLDENLALINRSYVLALSVCYHSRLCEPDLRKQYRYEIGQIFQTHKSYVGEKVFTKIIREEQEDYINRMQVPNNIVKNEALLENILVMTVCILTKIPIFVVGETGSSKSLALHLISSNLHGSESSDDYFKSLPKVHIVPYLCSSSATTDEISKIFEKANKYQETSSDVINVVLLDDVGLAESNSSDPLKLLHTLLEPNHPAAEPTISFVGLSNWRLNIVKSSRALLVQRPQFDLDDLVDITEHFLNTNVIEPSKISIIETLSKSYLDYKQHCQASPNFYGLRDYYSLIKRISSTEFTLENVQMELARNFGGLENNVKLWEKYFKEVIQIFNGDKSWSYKPLELIKSNLDDLDSRHLMIISKSEATVSLLVDQLQKRKMKPLVIIGSQFPDDRKDYHHDILKKITECVETGDPLILTDLEAVYANLYDLWDKNYIEANDKNLSRVRLGARSNLVFYVPPKFKCIVVMDEKNLCSSEPSLLNRFEKQAISFDDVLDQKQKSLIQKLKDWLERMYTCGSDPTIQLHDKFSLFFGFDKEESLQALVLDNTKDNRYNTDHDKILTKCKESLISVLSSDGVLRIERSALDRDEISAIKEIYFHQQYHDNLCDYFEHLFSTKNSSDYFEHLFSAKNSTEGDLIIVNTFSDFKTDIISCLGELTSCKVYKLSNFMTESQLTDRVEDFFLNSDDRILFIQCEDTITNSRYIKLTKHIIEKFNKNIIKVVCIINHIRRDCEQNLISNFIPGWKQITIESLEQLDIPLNKLYDKSLYDLLNSKIFRKLIVSSMPFEKFLKDKLEWCFSCIKYPTSNENYISVIGKEILRNENFGQYIKTKTFNWVSKNCNDWKYEVARNREYINQFTCFSLALQNYVMIIVKQIIAKILYSVEKLSATKTYFNLENCTNHEMKTELLELWKQCFLDDTVININNLPEPKPYRYEISSMINDLEFPFSYYFFNQINFYKIYYEEELDILRRDLDNINKETGELYMELIDGHIEDFKNNLLSVKASFKTLQKYPELYHNDFVRILSHNNNKLINKKEFDFIIENISEDKVNSNPFILHIYWWKHSESILIQLQLIETFPTIFEKAQEDFILYGRLEEHLFNEAINLVLQKICNNEEYEEEIDTVLSLADKISDTKKLTRLPLLQICNDLLKIKSIPLEKIKEIIYLGKSTRKQEFITSEIIELVFNNLDYNNDSNMTIIRSFIMKSLEIIPLESKVRLTLYKNLFTIKPFKLIKEIIEKILIIENQMKEGIFFTLIKNPKQTLRQSIRLNAINEFFEIKNFDKNMIEICCEIIQEIFHDFKLEKLIPCFKNSIEIYKKDIIFQRMISIAFLKEFAFKLWDYCKKEENILPNSLINDINNCLKIKQPIIRDLKYCLLIQKSQVSMSVDQTRVLRKVFPWIEDNINEELINIPRYYKPNRKVNFEDFRSFYYNEFMFNIDKYPFLSIYINHCEKLKLIKNLQPIIRFVMILNSKLEYNLTRKLAHTMTFREFIEKESSDDSVNLKSLFHNFETSWNIIINHIVDSKEFSRDKPLMNIERPVIFGLIEQKNPGIYLYTILEFLIRLQNEFLNNVLAIPNLFKPDLIKSIKVTQAQDLNFINFETDEKIISRHRQRNFELEGETKFFFDLQRIEMTLIKELIPNKVRFEKFEESQFYMKNFPFKYELFYKSPRILFDVKKLLLQEPITEKMTVVLTMFQPILSLNPDNSVNSVDIPELLSLFEIILSFIKELSISHGDTLIVDFVNQWLKLVRLDTSKYKIFSEFSLKHIVELYELIEEQNSDSIIHKIDDKFKVTLTQQMKKSINNFIDYNEQDEDFIPAVAFLLALKRFIYRFLSIETKIENINLNFYFLDFTLNLWPDYIKKELVENLFPNCLYVSHAYNCYTFIVNEIEKSKKVKKSPPTPESASSLIGNRKINVKKFK